MAKVDFTKIEFTAETKAELFNFCVANRLGLAGDSSGSGISAEDFNFHVTIMYSRVNSPDFAECAFEFGPHVVAPVGYDLFGPEGDLLVLKLDPEGILHDTHENYRQKYGHVSDFPDFKPHVTIRGMNLIPADRLHTLPLPAFELRVDRLVQKLKAI